MLVRRVIYWIHQFKDSEAAIIKSQVRKIAREEEWQALPKSIKWRCSLKLQLIETLLYRECYSFTETDGEQASKVEQKIATSLFQGPSHKIL